MKTLILLVSGAVLPALWAEVIPVNVAWLPVTDAELKMSSPIVDKNAGVEGLFWRVHVMDERFGDDLRRVLYHYVRLKVFTQEGKDKYTTQEIEYGDKTAIMEIRGRTTRPDGTAVELSKDAIHNRVLTKTKGFQRKAQTFSMPGVEVGSIIEYRWKEIQEGGGFMYLRLQFQREYPIQKVTYFVRPLPRDYTSFRMATRPFNCKPTPLKAEPDGFNSTTLENVPAFRSEPMMPGEPNVRPWMLLYYYDDDGLNRAPEKYWPGIGKKIYRELKASMRSSGEVKETVAKVTEGATSDEDKVLKILRYLRSNLRYFYGRNVTDAERSQFVKKVQKGGRTVPDILKSGVGTDDEMNTVFAELASLAGLDARPAQIGSRTDLRFDQRLAEAYFLPNTDMAVKIGERWKLYDVSGRLRLPQMLGWREEGQSALVADPKNPVFIEAPVSQPEDSVETRSAKLALSADGTIEGDVEETWTGHSAYDERVDYDGESEARQQEKVKEDLLETNKQAEVTAVQVENAENPEQLLKVRYHIRIPGYGQRTGKRLLFQPFFFQRGDAPVFSSSDRQYDIYFPYAWKESDRVIIALPPGFELEKAENPGGFDFGKPGSYMLKMSITPQRELVCARELIFGKDGMFGFAKAAYPQLKQLFDSIHAHDTHVLSLRQTAAGAVAQ